MSNSAPALAFLVMLVAPCIIAFRGLRRKEGVDQDDMRWSNLLDDSDPHDVAQAAGETLSQSSAAFADAALPITRRPLAAQTSTSSLGVQLAEAEREAQQAQMIAEKANRDALMAAARAAALRANAGTALAAAAGPAAGQAAQAVLETPAAVKLASVPIRTATRPTPAQVVRPLTPQRASSPAIPVATEPSTSHYLPEDHPSLDFPRSRVSHRAA